MNYQDVAAVLEELRIATEQLLPNPADDQLDIDDLEGALENRERAVARLSKLVARCPEAFTQKDFDQILEIHATGKRALDRVRQIRQTGWTKATHLSQQSYILRTFAQFDSSTVTTVQR